MSILLRFFTIFRLVFPQNRTAVHVLTLITLVDKCVHQHNEKSFACFVDFKKAFDSVWLDRLLFKLLQINVGSFFFQFNEKFIFKLYMFHKNLAKSKTAFSLRKKSKPRLNSEPVTAQPLN